MGKKGVILLTSGMLLGSLLMVGCDSKEVVKDTNGGDTVTEGVLKDDVSEGVEKPEDKPTKEELPKLDKEKEEELKELDEVEAKTEKVKIWIPNIEYVSSGDESLDMLLPVEVEGVSESKEADKYMRMLKTLNVSGDSPIQSVVFKSAKFANGLLTIDMGDATQLGIGGSTTEFMIIEQLKATIFNNFEEVSSIQLTVEGAIVETLLGHSEINEPFTR